MGKFLQSTKCKVILFVLSLLIGIMVYAVLKGGYTITGIGIFKNISAPFQQWSNAISQRVEFVLDMYTSSEQLYEENQALKAEVAALHENLMDYEATKEELADLKEFVGIKEENADFRLTSPCEVTGYITNDPYHAFMIDAGTEDGIGLYDPVVTQQGLVGMVTEVGERTATVTTILSPELSIAAKCSSTGESGVVTGSVSLSREGLCKMGFLNEETRLNSGQVILTSGESGSFPANYMIGFVKNIGMDETGMNAYAEVTPAVDVTALRVVVVITDFNGKVSYEDTNR